MKKLAAAALAATLAIPASGVAEAKNRTGRNLAIGIGAAIVTGVIISEAARARGRDYYSSDDHYRRCRQLLRQCDHGSDWACRKFDRNC